MIDRLVARVFATRNAAHLAHWAAKGPGAYARHMALGSFYETLIDKIDAIVEAYQGTNARIQVAYEAAKPNTDDIAAHISAEAEWIAMNRAAIANGSPSVANLVDDLHGLYATTAYLLTLS